MKSYRGIMYVNIGNLPKLKGEEHTKYIGEIVKEFWPELRIALIPVREQDTQLQIIETEF